MPDDHPPIDLGRLADELGATADADVQRKLRVAVTVTLTTTLSLSVLAAILLVFLVALGDAHLGDSVLLALIGATVAELAGRLRVVVGLLFPARKGWLSDGGPRWMGVGPSPRRRQSRTGCHSVLPGAEPPRGSWRCLPAWPAVASR